MLDIALNTLILELKTAAPYVFKKVSTLKSIELGFKTTVALRLVLLLNKDIITEGPIMAYQTPRTLHSVIVNPTDILECWGWDPNTKQYVSDQLGPIYVITTTLINKGVTNNDP